jgi:hypothetical protein
LIIDTPATLVAVVESGVARIDSMSTEAANGENGRRSVQPKKNPKKPVRPDFAERDDSVKVLTSKVKEYQDLAKTKLSELEALQNENKANNKLEGLRRALANTVHQRQQSQVRLPHFAPTYDHFAFLKRMGRTHVIS